MRDLKFRAWDRKKARMGFPLELTYMFSGDVSSGLMCYALDEKPIRQLNHEFDLMQYTGLKDKNEVEIYEGDIVKFKYANQRELYTGEARWCISGWEILTKHNGWFGSRYFEKSEVISNIYESKE